MLSWRPLGFRQRTLCSVLMIPSRHLEPTVRGSLQKAPPQNLAPVMHVLLVAWPRYRATPAASSSAAIGLDHTHIPVSTTQVD